MNDAAIEKLIGLFGKIVQQNDESLAQGRELLKQYGECIKQNTEYIAFVEKRDASRADLDAAELEVKRLQVEEAKFNHAQFLLQLQAMKDLGFDMREAAEHAIKLQLGKMEGDKKYGYPKAMREEDKLGQ